MTNLNLKYNMRQPVHLNNEIERLTSLIEHSDNYDMQSQTADLAYSYNTMLQMFASGVKDPMQNDIYNRLCTQCSRLITKAERFARLRQERYRLYTQTANRTQQTIETDEALKKLEQLGWEIRESDNKNEHFATLLEQREELRNELFDSTWTSDQWEQADFTCYQQFLVSTQTLPQDKQLIVSAITLALIEYVDVRKLELLTDIYTLGLDDETDARIMMGLVILLQLEGNIDGYRLDMVRQAFVQIMQQPKSQDDLYQILMACEFTVDTRERSEEIDNVIIPTLGQEIKNCQNGEEIESILSNFNEENLDSFSPKVRKVIKQYRMLKRDGADTSYNVFTTLKDYGFLNELAHWFAPFELYQTKIWNAIQDLNPTAVKLVTDNIKSMSISHIDKYKLFFNFTQQSEQLNALSNDLPFDEDVLDMISSTDLSRKEIMHLTVYSMWRFLSFHPSHQEIPWCRQPEQAPIPQINSTEIVRYIVLHTTTCHLGQELMDFLIRYNKEEQAAHFADSCLEQELYANNPTFNLLAAKAYIATRQQEKAEKCLYITYGSGIEPIETLYLMAQTATMKGNYSDAASYYSMLLREEPENKEWLMEKALCHSKAGESQQAIKTLYELCYLDNGQNRTRMALAKELFKNKQTDKAIEQLNLLTSNQTNPKDEEEACFLKGTILAALHRIPEAIQAFSEAYEMNQINIKKDKQHLSFFEQADRMLCEITDMELLYQTEYLLDIAMKQINERL